MPNPTDWTCHCMEPKVAPLCSQVWAHWLAPKIGAIVLPKILWADFIRIIGRTASDCLPKIAKKEG